MGRPGEDSSQISDPRAKRGFLDVLETWAWAFLRGKLHDQKENQCQICWRKQRSQNAVLAQRKAHENCQRVPNEKGRVSEAVERSAHLLLNSNQRKLHGKLNETFGWEVGCEKNSENFRRTFFESQSF